MRQRSARWRASRVHRHGAVSTALALLSDRELGELVDAAAPLGSGIGGQTRLLRVEGVPVFVKRVALTDVERRPENVRSTANLFGLPPWTHYGLGSAGGGVWRELAVHLMATDWVLASRCEGFPLLHHWRALPRPARPLTRQQRAELEASVAFWHGSPAVRLRLEAIGAASAEVLLFLEYLPSNLLDWLDRQASAGPDAVDDACAMVERELIAAASAMESGGLLHFDAHARNILTDGRRLYISDFGLASSLRFEVDAAEARFLAEHAEHDRCYLVTQLVNWIATTLAGAGRHDPGARNALVCRCAAGEDVPGLPPSAAAILHRYAPIAAVVNDFYFSLYTASRQTPYPRRELQRVLGSMPRP